MKSALYLTFDDGPLPATSGVLDAMRAAQVKATFFLTAINLEANPVLQYALVRRMIDEGHVLGNHGYDHDPATRKGYLQSAPDAVRKDFTDNQEKFAALFAKKNATFPGFTCARLPGDGRFMSNYVSMITRDIKLPHVGWDFEFSVNGRMGHIRHNDWQGLKGVAGTQAGIPGPNNIVLLHDAHWSGKGGVLAELFKVLKQGADIRVMRPIPGGHTAIKYPA
jgi:peptidoglycan/xylan/chitin deacetylase (PgdA/CDA1 family)